MKRFRSTRSGFAWLELLLVLAVLVLLFEVFPSLWECTLWALDIRNWPRTAWFAANFVVLFALAAIRFGPDLLDDWRNRRERQAADREKQHKQQELKEQREVLERMQAAQKRRVY
jgi:uncharacterized membrane protein YqjE